MSYQILCQPDGRFALFSSVTGTIELWDATDTEIEDWFVAEAIRKTRDTVSRAVEKVAKNQARSVYHRFTLSWEEATALDKQNNGDLTEFWIKEQE